SRELTHQCLGIVVAQRDGVAVVVDEIDVEIAGGAFAVHGEPWLIPLERQQRVLCAPALIPWSASTLLPFAKSCSTRERAPKRTSRCSPSSRTTRSSSASRTTAS